MKLLNINQFHEEGALDSAEWIRFGAQLVCGSIAKEAYGHQKILGKRLSKRFAF